VALGVPTSTVAAEIAKVVIALTQADNCNLARADSTYAFDQLDSMAPHVM